MKKDIETRADIDELLIYFYSIAIKDELIGYIFTDVAELDLQQHLPIIGDFWETLLFRTGDYQRHKRKFGLLAGISFIETPLKFQAPNMTIALGLGIGRLVFFALNKIEIILALLMLISFVKAKPKNKIASAAFRIVVVLLFLETVWLLPVLDARASLVISGDGAPESNIHLIYIVFDALKLVLLFVLGTILIKQNLKIEV